MIIMYQCMSMQTNIPRFLRQLFSLQLSLSTPTFWLDLSSSPSASVQIPMRTLNCSIQSFIFLPHFHNRKSLKDSAEMFCSKNSILTPFVGSSSAGPISFESNMIWNAKYCARQMYSLYQSLEFTLLGPSPLVVACLPLLQKFSKVKFGIAVYRIYFRRNILV